MKLFLVVTTEQEVSTMPPCLALNRHCRALYEFWLVAIVRLVSPSTMQIKLPSSPGFKNSFDNPQRLPASPKELPCKQSSTARSLSSVLRQNNALPSG